MDESEFFTGLKKYHTKNLLFKMVLEKFADDIRKLACSLNLNKNSRVLDAGCGNGFLMKELRKRITKPIFYGIDILEKSVNYARGLNPNSKFFVGNIENMPFKDNFFDLVLCSEVIEHICSPEKAIKEIKRITKKYAIVCVPYEPFFTIANLARLKYLRKFGNYPGHVQRFGKTKLNKLLKKYFQKVLISNSTFWLVALCEK